MHRAGDCCLLSCSGATRFGPRGLRGASLAAILYTLEGATQPRDLPRCRPLEEVATPLGGRSSHASEGQRGFPPPTECVALPEGARVSSRNDVGVPVGTRSATVIGLLARATARQSDGSVHASDLPRTVYIRAHAGGHEVFRLTVNSCVSELMTAAEGVLEARGNAVSLRHDARTSAVFARCGAHV